MTPQKISEDLRGIQRQAFSGKSFSEVAAELYRVGKP